MHFANKTSDINVVCMNKFLSADIELYCITSSLLLKLFSLFMIGSTHCACAVSCTDCCWTRHIQCKTATSRASWSSSSCCSRWTGTTSHVGWQTVRKNKWVFDSFTHWFITSL